MVLPEGMLIEIRAYGKNSLGLGRSKLQKWIRDSLKVTPVSR